MLVLRISSEAERRAFLQVVLDTLEYGSAIKKTPVVVGNCTGFAVNRVFFPYTQAACLLVDLGLDPYKIDKAILAGFGMPMGPFRSASCWPLTPQCLHHAQAMPRWLPKLALEPASPKGTPRAALCTYIGLVK